MDYISVRFGEKCWSQDEATTLRLSDAATSLHSMTAPAAAAAPAAGQEQEQEHQQQQHG